MAANRMTTMLKRQKETKRAAKAARKREARQSRNQAKAADGETGGPPIAPLEGSSEPAGSDSRG